ncbi:hypothetical protein CDEST_01747 [Colletotrichum destructivum]|uniref:Uncharacterized protein n=1 Tax=Colletotrichum destructivum TaxID=34406 RepID=A0AAX4I165_9PEZI|nr:hypothetical protein CDEST_01747 [Colletotrichum destructivum]
MFDIGPAVRPGSRREFSQDFGTSSICSLTKSCHVGSSMPYSSPRITGDLHPCFQYFHARNINWPKHYPTMGNKPWYLESIPAYATLASG